MAFRRMVRRRRTMRRGRKALGAKRRYGGGIRKRTYKKRRMGGRRRMGGGRVGTTEAAKQLAVYMNPFSVATQQPKIPDGSKNFSLGVSYRSVNTLTCDANNTHITIAVIPCAHNMCMAIKHAEAVVTNPFTAAAVADIQWHKSSFVATPVNVAGTGADATMNLGGANMESWRMVSAGVKISCINNSLGNDGHWQAIRLRQCQFAEALYGAAAGLGPLLASTPTLSDWANDPTYSSGRLKDIGKKSFMLAQNGEHHWRDWTSNPVKLADFANATPLWFDDSLDIVLIRISGVATAAHESKILINAFGNYEMTFNSDDNLSHFMTQTMQVSPATLQKVQNKKKYLTRKAAS